ncbi:MAG: heavy-metal-associated domain-containing protein [Rubrobacteraceae bacterium]
MPDVTLVVQNVADTRAAGRLERVLKRLEFVHEANVDPEKGLVAVSYEGAGSELNRLERAVKEAGYDFEPSPGARKLEQ